MAGNRPWLYLAVVIAALALPGVQPVQGQKTEYPPAGEYLLLWQPSDDAQLGCTPRSEGEGSMPAVRDRAERSRPNQGQAAQSGLCGHAAGVPVPGPCSSESRPPERLWDLVLDLQTRGQVKILEMLADRPGLRLLAEAAAAARLADHPETERLQLIRPVAALLGEERDSSAAMSAAAPLYTVSGTVVDYDGVTPLQDIYVAAQGPGSDYAYTDSNGQYTLDLPAGLYCLSVSSWDLPGPAPQSVLVPDQTTADFTFPQRYTISGIVRDYSGTPVEGSWVRTASGPAYDSAYTGPDGSYSLLVTAGEYTVEAEQDGRADRVSVAVSVPPDQPGTDLTFPEAYTISGTVHDANGTPLGDVTVDACPGGGGYCTYDFTGSDGLYELLVSAGTWRLGAYASDLPSPPDQTVTVPPARVVDFTFPAVQPYTISGTVRDTGGNPLEDIWVTAGTEDCWSDSYSSTAADGRYTITLTSAGSYLVEAGMGRQLAAVPPDAAGVDFVLYTIAGTVRDAGGQPVPDALVEIVVAGQDLYYHGVYDYTDASGSYALHVAAGTYQVGVSRAGYASPPPQPVTVPPDQSGVDLAFLTGYHVQGLVRDGSGEPIASAEVQAEGSAGSASAWTSDCGTYDLVLPAGTYAVTASEWGYTSPAPQNVTVPPDRFDVNVTLTELAFSTIAGTVRDSGASPVQGAYVYASGPNDSDSDTTDASGAYQLQVLSSTYEVRVSKSGYHSPPAQTVSVPPDRTGFDLTFPAQYAVSGTVRDGSSQAVSGAGVRAEAALCGSREGEAQTDATGAYTLLLTAGTYDIGAGKDNYAATSLRQVTVPPAAGGADLTIPLPVRYTVSGVVRGSDGVPLADVDVYASACGRPGGSAYTAADGSYSLSLAAGTYTIGVDPWDSEYASQERSLTVSGDTPNVDFNLSLACCTIYGQVTDDEGYPLDGAEVEVVDGPEWDSNETYSCGRYRLVLEEPGTYTLQAMKAGYAASSPRTVTLPPRRADLDFALTRLPGSDSTVSGTVRGESAQPLAGASVYVWFCGVHYCTSWWWDTTNTQGQYSEVVPPGSYEVEADHACYTDAPSQEITVPPNVTVDFTLLHRKTNRVSGRVTDNHGAPVYGAYVWASSSAGYVSTTSNSNGDYLLRLSPGTWTLAAMGRGCSYLRPPDKSVTVPPNQTNVDFVLLMGEYTVEGDITDGIGAPMANVRVGAEASGLGSTYVYSDDAGHYLFHLPAATWLIQPSRADYIPRPTLRSVMVPPNQVGVNFQMVQAQELYLPLICKTCG